MTDKDYMDIAVAIIEGEVAATGVDGKKVAGKYAQQFCAASKAMDIKADEYKKGNRNQMKGWCMRQSAVVGRLMVAMSIEKDRREHGLFQ